MKIHRISCFYHDSAASIIVDNEILASAQVGRFTRGKTNTSFTKRFSEMLFRRNLKEYEKIQKLLTKYITKSGLLFKVNYIYKKIIY